MMLKTGVLTSRSQCMLKKNILNAMSVDVEDYFHVSAFESVINRADWNDLECRVEQNTYKAMAVFSEYEIKATFFVLGWVAERYPQLVKDIVSNGHELASHGYSHSRITQLSQEVFRAEIRDTKRLLEDIAGVVVRGYRAPSYSIVTSTLWAHEVLVEEGYDYSSSVYPIVHDLYGIPDAPRFNYKVEEGRLSEIPISTLNALGRNWPCGGGGYFRFFPYQLSKYMINHVNENEEQACIFYFHPWELDPGQPRQSGISRKTQFRHYLNLDHMESRLKKLLGDFSWGRMDEVFVV